MTPMNEPRPGEGTAIMLDLLSVTKATFWMYGKEFLDVAMSDEMAMRWQCHGSRWPWRQFLLESRFISSDIRRD